MNRIVSKKVGITVILLYLTSKWPFPLFPVLETLNFRNSIQRHEVLDPELNLSSAVTHNDVLSRDLAGNPTPNNFFYGKQ